MLSTIFPADGRITCVRGCLWITRDGGDIVIGGGESPVCHRHAGVLTEALESSDLEIVR